MQRASRTGKGDSLNATVELRDLRANITVETDLADMDDETLESAAILAAMTHRMTGSREAYDRLRDINAERRRRANR